MVVPRITPLRPTTLPVCSSANETPTRSRYVGLRWGVQVEPQQAAPSKNHSTTSTESEGKGGPRFVNLLCRLEIHPVASTEPLPATSAAFRQRPPWIVLGTPSSMRTPPRTQ